MKNLWEEKKAKKYISEYSKLGVPQDLALRIYTTHLLGSEKKLVLHGGGNTSVKSLRKDIFSAKKKVIFVKGSGWDMSNLNHLGMPGLYLDPLLRTTKLKNMSDEKMVNYLRSNLLDSNSPNPSVETLLHAYIPEKYVDHTHSNAILSLVNLEESKNLLKEIFKNKLTIIPYIMPGFQLAKLCHDIYKVNKKVDGLLLLNHGIFTFGNTAKESYDRMIKYVSIAEKYIFNNKKKITFTKKNKINLTKDFSPLIRNYLYKIDNNKWIVQSSFSNKDKYFTQRNDLFSIFDKGPVTPDHVIRIKSKPLIIKSEEINKVYSNPKVLEKLISKYAIKYHKYFIKYKNEIHNCKISDSIPRIIILQGIGFLSIGRNIKEVKISKDIFCSMKDSIVDANYLGKFKSINTKEIFKMEYWPLERAKLNNQKRKQLEGNIAVITGGGGTIGLAVAKKFIKEGLTVVLIDKKFNQQDNESNKIYKNCIQINCDLTKNNQIDNAIKKIIYQFGGIDILISNAGASFQGSIDNVSEKIIRDSFDINFYAHHKITQKIINIMKLQNMGGSIMFNLSKQAINPGKDFGPYGLAKSSALFLMKQYALETGHYNIRVNGINADRVQSGFLTKKLIKERSIARNISSQKYLINNLLKQEVLPEDVAEAFFSQILLKKTTGNIITVDGGNIEASLR